MKLFIIFIFLIFPPFLVFASNTDKYNECILQYLPNSRIPYVTRLIKAACKDNSRTMFAPNENDRAYNDCLLENLQEVEDEDVAKEILKSCKDKYKS